jgi:hypothetical protein
MQCWGEYTTGDTPVSRLKTSKLRARLAVLATVLPLHPKRCLRS